MCMHTIVYIYIYIYIDIFIQEVKNSIIFEKIILTAFQV